MYNGAHLYKNRQQHIRHMLTYKTLLKLLTSFKNANMSIHLRDNPNLFFNDDILRNALIFRYLHDYLNYISNLI